MDSARAVIFAAMGNMLIDAGVKYIEPESDLRNELGMTSLSLIELRDKVEDRFGVCIIDAAWSGINTFDEAVDHVRTLWGDSILPTTLTA